MNNTLEYNFLCYAHDKLKKKQKQNRIGFTFGFCAIYYLYSGDKDYSNFKYIFPDFWDFIKEEKSCLHPDLVFGLDENETSWFFNNASERLEVLNKYLADKYNIVLE